MIENDARIQPLMLTEHEGRYSLSLNGGSTSVDELIEELGHTPNGYFWEGVSRLLVEADAPELANRFETDPEAGMLVAFGTDILGRLLASYANDADKMRTLMVETPTASASTTASVT